jgi:hypothetical protein
VRRVLGMLGFLAVSLPSTVLVARVVASSTLPLLVARAIWAVATFVAVVAALRVRSAIDPSFGWWPRD